MKLLGVEATAATIRKDMVYLHARLVADERAGVQALAPEVAAQIMALREERELFERAEEASTVALAARDLKDFSLGRRVIQFGGEARVSEPALYSRCFARRSPSKTAQLKPSDELLAVGRILKELGALPEEHPLRAAHFAAISAGHEALRLAVTASHDVQFDLSLARTKLAQFKLDCDRVRQVIHGRLQAFFGSVAQADEFFYSYRSAATEEEEEPEEVDAAEASAEVADGEKVAE
jgi:hypothetical protein